MNAYEVMWLTLQVYQLLDIRKTVLYFIKKWRDTTSQSYYSIDVSVQAKHTMYFFPNFIWQVSQIVQTSLVYLCKF